MNLLVVHPNQENYVCSSRAEQEVEAYWEPWLLGHGCPQVEQNCTRRDYCKRMLGLGVKCPHGANMGLGSAHLLPPTHTIVLGLPPPPHPPNLIACGLGTGESWLLAGRSGSRPKKLTLTWPGPVI